ncbi:hypothetical protein [Treponema primitia]|uniref:hypothetical protein n=1 Tax=Treponema primitia TaxID=88058 RepID=UPI00025551AD|nr:hypothetical protein [Treponema primitia]
MMNMKADKNGAMHLAVLLGFALLMAGCAVPVSGPGGNVAGGGGLGTVRVEISGLVPEPVSGVSAAPVSGVSATPKLRTAYPTPPSTSGLFYTYTWTDIGSGTTVTPEKDGENFILAVGNYTLDVEAYVGGAKNPAKLVGTGVGKVDDGTTITVNGSVPTITVTVALEPVDGTVAETATVTGTLAYTITYPAGVTTLSLTLQKLGDDGEPVTTLSPTSTTTNASTGVTTATGTTNVAAGDYLLRATLGNSAGAAGMSETVRIYGNMTTTVPPTSDDPDPDPSAASFAFAAGDFGTMEPHIIGVWAGGYTVEVEGGLIKSITPTNKTAILIGRRADEQVTLNIGSDGKLLFRAPDDAGNVPIGSYGEFQLIRTGAGTVSAAIALTGTYKQEADLDLMGNLSPRVEWTAVGKDGASFTGTFDGGGKAISNLYINTTSNVQGLFGNSNGTVQNVHIASGFVTGASYVGGLVGSNGGAIIACSNSSDISVTGVRVGGVVGYSAGPITACYNTGAVSGTDDVGGVVGDGRNPITACSNTGPVSGNDEVGGVVGTNNAAIIACYNTGPVSGSSYIGGVVGYNHNGTTTACYWANFTGNGVGINYSSGTVDTTKFASGAWPSTGTEAGQSGQWGTGNGSGSGTYWKDLGGWNGGSTNTVYPTLWWE